MVVLICLSVQCLFVRGITYKVINRFDWMKRLTGVYRFKGQSTQFWELCGSCIRIIMRIVLWRFVCVMSKCN